MESLSPLNIKFHLKPKKSHLHNDGSTLYHFHFAHNVQANFRANSLNIQCSAKKRANLTSSEEKRTNPTDY